MNSTGAVNFVFSEAIDWPLELTSPDSWNSTNSGKDAIEITITSEEADAKILKYTWDVVIQSNNTFTV
jgi:hypothetical protein